MFVYVYFCWCPFQKKLQDGKTYIDIYIYLELVCPLFWCFKPSKTRPPIKAGVIWVSSKYIYIYIYFFFLFHPFNRFPFQVGNIFTCHFPWSSICVLFFEFVKRDAVKPIWFEIHPLKTWKWNTLPETNSQFTPYWGVWAYFQVLLLLVSGSVVCSTGFLRGCGDSPNLP